MTIQEALKSGKAFRRKPQPRQIIEGLRLSEKWNGIHGTPTSWQIALTVDDILADDWEIKQEPIVFEASWTYQHGVAIPAVYPPDYPDHEAMKEMVGKRTRVTIEVLD